MIDGAVRNWEEHTCRAMGSSARIVLGDAPDGVLRWAAGELSRLERSWSRFDPDSELRRMDGRSGRVPVSSALAEAVERSLHLWRATRGRFDPTVRDALVAAGYDRSFAEVAPEDPCPAPPAVPAPGAASIRLDRGALSVDLPPGVHLDLGGIGKGLAADLLATGAVDRGVRAAAVALGGDIRVAGTTPEPDGWRIPVADPCVGHADGRSPGTAQTRRNIAVHVPLADAAIVTTTRHLRRWCRGGVEHHHVIDPATGRSAWTGMRAVIVRAGAAWWAEGLAKAAFVAGPMAGAALLREHGVDGWLVDDAGQWMGVGRAGVDPAGRPRWGE